MFGTIPDDKSYGSDDLSSSQSDEDDDEDKVIGLPPRMSREGSTDVNSVELSTPKKETPKRTKTLFPNKSH